MGEYGRRLSNYANTLKACSVQSISYLDFHHYAHDQKRQCVPLPRHSSWPEQSCLRELLERWVGCVDVFQRFFLVTVVPDQNNHITLA